MGITSSREKCLRVLELFLITVIRHAFSSDNTQSASQPPGRKRALTNPILTTYCKIRRSTNEFWFNLPLGEEERREGNDC